MSKDPDDFFETVTKTKPAYEAIVARIARSLHSPDSFNEVEIHARLKPGLEIPLMGVATMPDVIQDIYRRRLDEDKEVRKALEMILETLNNGGVEAANAKLDELMKLAVDEKTGKVDEVEKYRVEQLKVRVLKALNMKDEERGRHLERLEARLLTQSKRLRYEHAEKMLSSMVRHLYQISMAIEGKRAEQGVENIKAIVLHEQDMLEALSGKNKERRWLGLRGPAKD